MVWALLNNFIRTELPRSSNKISEEYGTQRIFLHPVTLRSGRHCQERAAYNLSLGVFEVVRIVIGPFYSHQCASESRQTAKSTRHVARVSHSAHVAKPAIQTSPGFLICVAGIALSSCAAGLRHYRPLKKSAVSDVFRKAPAFPT